MIHEILGEILYCGAALLFQLVYIKKKKKKKTRCYIVADPETIKRTKT